mgnify:CR=1 FL=1
MVYVNVKVNEKGQIVIPKVFRDAYGIEPMSEVMLGEKDNELVIERKMSKNEWSNFLRSFPKIKMEKIDSGADYAEELESR